MRILDENGIEIESPDYELGYLKPDRIFISHHESIDAVEEQGHWETIAEYPNGGKDVDWIVDIPGEPAKEAWDEYEDIQRFVKYTESEIAIRKIEELKQQLSSTDYVALKIVEGAATLEDYADIIAQRSKWRAEINTLEAKLTEDT